MVSERDERQLGRVSAEIPPEGAGGGRDPGLLPVTLGGTPEDLDRIKRFRELGVARVNFPLMSEKAEAILPILDRLAGRDAARRQLGGTLPKKFRKLLVSLGSTRELLTTSGDWR